MHAQLFITVCLSFSTCAAFICHVVLVNNAYSGAFVGLNDKDSLLVQGAGKMPCGTSKSSNSLARSGRW